MNDLLKSITDAPGTSGYEDDVREIIKTEIKKYVDSIKVDKVGNLIASKGSGSPKILLIAHMDKLGLMVKHIDEKGFVRFEPVGGWDQRTLPSQRVVIHGSKKPVSGVIGHKPIHIQEKDEAEKVIKMKDLFIDIGAKNKKDVENLGVSVGDFINYYTGYDTLSNGKLVGSGFDNRVGCFELVEILKAAKGFKGTVYAAFTISEEIGLVGARGSIFGVNPDAVIGLDTTIAGDFPGITSGEVIPELGKGPVIGIKDAISVINKNVRLWLEKTAKENKIKYQYDILDRGATDSSISAMVREGVPSGALLTPTRYIHTSVEVLDMSDVKNIIKLAVLAVKSSPKYFK